jgi:glutathione S-transferase
VELAILVVCLALLQYLYFAFLVGKARARYGIKAPATAGHPLFERQLRVQQNTLEQLVVFVPVQFTFPFLAENLGWPGYEIAAVLGVVWLIGRGLYARNYVRDPLSRSAGFLLTLVPSALLLAGSLVCVFVSLL